MQVKDFYIDSYFEQKTVLDLRTLLLLNMSMSVLMFFSSMLVATAAAFAVSFILMLLFKMPKTAFKYAATFTLFEAAGFLVHIQTNLAFTAVFFSTIGYLGFMFAKILPLIMISHIIVKKIDSSTLVYTLRKMGLHKGFVLSLTVALRFLPTARQEYLLIKECMKMRGLEISAKTFFKNPALTIEYSLVPLLFRCVKISEEMTAAAMVKGVEYDGAKTSLIAMSFSAFDFICLFAAAIIIGGALLFEKNPQLFCFAGVT